jgi:hypothetical protein
MGILCLGFKHTFGRLAWKRAVLEANLPRSIADGMSVGTSGRRQGSSFSLGDVRRSTE